MAPDLEKFRNTIFVLIHPSARKHRVPDEDGRHAMRNAMVIETQTRGRSLWIGPARSSELLEVVTVGMEFGFEVAIHVMPMRSKYERLLHGRD